MGLVACRNCLGKVFKCNKSGGGGGGGGGGSSYNSGGDGCKSNSTTTISTSTINNSGEVPQSALTLPPSPLRPLSTNVALDNNSSSNSNSSYNTAEKKRELSHTRLRLLQSELRMAGTSSQHAMAIERFVVTLKSKDKNSQEGIELLQKIEWERKAQIEVNIHLAKVRSDLISNKCGSVYLGVGLDENGNDRSQKPRGPRGRALPVERSKKVETKTYAELDEATLTELASLPGPPMEKETEEDEERAREGDRFSRNSVRENRPLLLGS
jgi:hypothetical protein